MGTTLEHGVYLPDEGERNCYAGLKVNWETLDQKVADISALQSAIAGALHREIVATLPTTDIDPNTIYMILSGTSATENVYNEFMYVNNAWELIGTSATDLTNYYTKAEVDGKLLLKASASDLTSHTGDTTIHVTASDKAKWNTVALIKQLRLVNTQVGSATTIAFANIDDTNGIKVGDKCMDLDGRMFEITAVDTTNQTVTVGTALIDLALDANVVHNSGNETISGTKTFLDVPIPFKSSTAELGVTGGSTNVTFLDKNDKKLAGLTLGSYSSSKLSYARLNIFDKDTNNNEIQDTLEYAYVSNNNNAYLRVSRDNFCTLGSSLARWKGVYAQSYYYGSDNVEFSTKFVTTDTAQTISGAKTFSSTPVIYNSDTSGSTANLYLRNQLVTKGDTSSSGNQTIRFADVNDKLIGRIQSNKVSNGASSLNLRAETIDAGNNDVIVELQILAGCDGSKSFSPQVNNSIDLGRTLAKWKNLLVNQINGLTPSSLSMPSDTSIDISGYITDFSGGNNQYTAPANGIVAVDISGTNRYVLYNNNLSIGDRLTGTNFRRAGIIQVRKNDTVIIQSDGGTLNYAKFYPCQGNI